MFPVTLMYRVHVGMQVGFDRTVFYMKVAITKVS